MIITYAEITAPPHFQNITFKSVSHYGKIKMDFFKECLCLSTTPVQEHTYEEIELQPNAGCYILMRKRQALK